MMLGKDKCVAVEPFPEQENSGPSVISGFAMAKGKNSLVKAEVVIDSTVNGYPIRAGEPVWVTAETTEKKFPVYILDDKRFVIIPESEVILVGQLRPYTDY
jgi:hypothetical protein